MPTPELVRDLELLVRSRYALIFLETLEEERTEDMLRYLASSLGLPFFTWTPSKGLKRTGMDGAAYDTTTPLKALEHVESARLAAIYHFQGLAPHLDDQPVQQKLRDAASQFSKNTGAVFVSGGGITVPDFLNGLATIVTVPTPDITEYKELLDRVIREVSKAMPIQVTMHADDTMRLLTNLRGVTLLEAERVLRRAILSDNKLAPDDIALVVEAKKEAVQRAGVLEYFSPDEALSDIAGLAGLKTWLGKRRTILSDPRRAEQFGLSFPKGILLLGVPGCGKSLCAKAVAREWTLPLLKLDAGALYDKYIGQSEKNFRRAMTVAEQMSPAVLWIDEIEKAFASSSGEQDGGLSTRLLGGFLSWMQERHGDVFVVATANDVSRLPPELMRKGRFDEIFFVDLPTAAARQNIFALHLRKRRQSPEHFDLAALATASDGFSGSEIEQAVVSALYTAFSQNLALSTDLVLDEIRGTHPLSQTMHEKLAALRQWASEKTTNAE